MSGKINVEVVYALPDEQTLFKQSVPEGARVAEAIQLCGILETYPQIDLAANKLGIFGKLAKADTVLRDKDRIEIYRPLLADPKEVRRKRAGEGRVMKKGSSMCNFTNRNSSHRGHRAHRDEANLARFFSVSSVFSVANCWESEC